MSRIGKNPIRIPEDVTVEIEDQMIKVKGPKGELKLEIHPHVQVLKTEQEVKVTVKNPQEKIDRALWGLSRALIFNMMEGVTRGYEKKLEINGVGYRASVSGRQLVLQVGFSHPVEFDLPEGVEAKVEKNVITLSGIDKQLVGETAARIRAIRKPEPYKGTGIKYVDEVIRKKAGKKAVSIEGAGGG